MRISDNDKIKIERVFIENKINILDLSEDVPENLVDGNEDAIEITIPYIDNDILKDNIDNDFGMLQRSYNISFKVNRNENLYRNIKANNIKIMKYYFYYAKDN